MARREAFIPKMVVKEIWDNFKAKEMEALVAYAYAFDGIWPYRKQSVDIDKGEVKFEEKPIPMYRRDLHHNPRPWTCYERFLRAVTAFSRKMEDNPSQGLRFAIAFLEADGTINSGDYILDDSETRKSKEIYFHLVGKNGMAWGDESKLKEYAAGYGGDLCRKFGFKEVPAPPFSGEIEELTGVSSLTETKFEGNLEPVGELKDEGRQVPIIPKKRGRQAKTEAATV